MFFMEDTDLSYDRKRLSKWLIGAFYFIIFLTLVAMIATNRSPADSPIVETIIDPSCLAPEIINCGRPTYRINAPFVIAAFFVLASILVLYLRPWHVQYSSTPRTPE